MKIKLTAFLVLFASFSLFSQELPHHRDKYVQPDRVMDTLGIKEGMIIGEAGAGEGYLTFHLAKRVGEKGKIFANDISISSLNSLNKEAKKRNLRNIETITGKVDDPLFPKDTLDLVIIIMAFHDFTEPGAWLNNLKKYFGPETRLVIIERDPDRFGRSYDHFLTKDKLIKTVENGGFNLKKMYDFLERDNIYVFKLKRF